MTALKKEGGRTGPSPHLSQSSASTPAGDTKGTCGCIWNRAVTCSLICGLRKYWPLHVTSAGALLTGAERRQGSDDYQHLKRALFCLSIRFGHHTCREMNQCKCSKTNRAETCRTTCLCHVNVILRHMSKRNSTLVGFRPSGTVLTLERRPAEGTRTPWCTERKRLVCSTPLGEKKLNI